MVKATVTCCQSIAHYIAKTCYHSIYLYVICRLKRFYSVQSLTFILMCK